MKHIGAKTLETPRLILRKFTENDGEAMYRNWASDPEVTKFLTWPTHSKVEISNMIAAQWVKDSEKPDYYQWAIVLKELDEPIGSISVVNMDEKTDSAEIGYCIGKAWWGKGIMSEALTEIIRFAFEGMLAKRVHARHDSNNPASGAVMKKCGMTYEGTLRKADYNNQGICDMVCYSILRGEYHKN